MRELLITMSLPPLFSMFLQYSYNLIDSAFVAKLSEDALTAVSLSFPLTTLMNACSVGLGVGANVLIAGFLGEKKQDEANRTTAIGLVLSVIMGVLLNLLVLVLMQRYFRAFTDNEPLYTLCIRYMWICAFMQIPNMVHIMIQKILQATGNMLSPMWFQIAGVVLNLTFDPLLIFGIGPFPRMEIEGAAVATVMGYVVSMILALIQLFGGKQAVTVSFRDVHPDWKIVGKIFLFGFPSFIMNALSSLTVTITNLFLVYYSETAIAFFGAYYKVQQLIMMTVNGLIQGCLPVMRYNYGAGTPDRVRSAFRYGTFYACFMMGVGMLIVLLFPSQVLDLFSASSEMRSFGIGAERLMSIGYIFCGLTTMIATYFQAVERVSESIILQLLRQLLILIPAMLLLNRCLSLTGIWLSFPVTEIISCMIACVLLQLK